MSDLSQADLFLLKGIRAGDADAWTQLVDRYRGRLLAFALSRVRTAADAEDLVQDTFLNFLRGLGDFREQTGLETYLFVILRRRLASHYRRRNVTVCLLQDLHGRPSGAERPFSEDRLPASDPTASTYARRAEQDQLRRRALAEAIRGLVSGLRESLNFHDLQIMEMLFYCQLPNKRVAELAGVSPQRVGLIKHRSLQETRQSVARILGRDEEFLGDELLSRVESMLTEVWEDLRLSCPKRSTVGAHMLGTLDGPWAGYVNFHLHTLGCRFCLANLEDLRSGAAAGGSAEIRDRILQSTVGFLRKANSD